MYFYLCHRGRVWNPYETLVLFASYNFDYYEQGDYVHPEATDAFDGITIVGPIDTEQVREAMRRGPVPVYSHLPACCIEAELGLKEGTLWKASTGIA